MQRNRGKDIIEKTRDLFKKTGDMNRKFYARMGTIKYRNGKDMIEVD